MSEIKETKGAKNETSEHLVDLIEKCTLQKKGSMDLKQVNKH